jgi:hypothetical protein
MGEKRWGTSANNLHRPIDSIAKSAPVSSLSNLERPCAQSNPLTTFSETKRHHQEMATNFERGHQSFLFVLPDMKLVQ